MLTGMNGWDMSDTFAEMPVIDNPQHPFSQEKLTWWRTVLELAFLVLAGAFLLFRFSMNPLATVKAAGEARLG